ncbi:hypothetical protein Cri9333_2032 [Crinalium epipsammum PCC 9333]|uniref:Uncharacterized protein n=1 Tax=Crinalium epipsammum PCC 9333 TaxID=1173022 RepID=K9VY55_9CYAN|nr:hypothetical protein [Crinalium epipsammum]AFZ12911.1 hypothetical protein Cri9333_2032 [Crinalium epipsammum PCC 9333]
MQRIPHRLKTQVLSLQAISGATAWSGKLKQFSSKYLILASTVDFTRTGSPLQGGM